MQKQNLVKTQISLKKSQLLDLQKISVLENESVAALIRECVDGYIAKKNTELKKSKDLLLNMAGSAGSFGDPIAWNKLDDFVYGKKK
jgi:endonuclease III-like uncharacterized protein